MERLLIGQVLPRVRHGKAIADHSLTLMPLLGGGRRTRDYVLTHEAVAGGLLEVRAPESQNGPVTAWTRAASLILLPDGQEVCCEGHSAVLTRPLCLRRLSRTSLPTAPQSERRILPWQPGPDPDWPAPPCPFGACGVIAFVGGAFLAMDLFDSPSAVSSLWHGLIRGYRQAAMNGSEDAASADSDPGAVIARIAGMAASQEESAGLGTQLLFERAGLSGTALSLDGHLVHLHAGREDGRPTGTPRTP